MAQEKTPKGIPYESESAGTSGARYYLMPTKNKHTKEDIEEAKSYLRNNFDVVNITVEKTTYNGKTKL